MSNLLDEAYRCFFDEAGRQGNALGFESSSMSLLPTLEDVFVRTSDAAYPALQLAKMCADVTDRILSLVGALSRDEYLGLAVEDSRTA